MTQFGSGFTNFDYGPHASGFGVDTPEPRKRIDYGKLFEDPVFLFGASLLGQSANPNAMATAMQVLTQTRRGQLDKQRMEQMREHELAQLEQARQQAMAVAAREQQRMQFEQEKHGFDRERFTFERDQKFPLELRALQGKGDLAQQEMEMKRAELGLKQQEFGAKLSEQERARAMQDLFMQQIQRSGVFGPAGGGAPSAQPSGATGKHGTPTQLLDNLMQVESGGNPRAVNPQSGAMGAYQFMPGTVDMLRKQGITFDPFNAEQSRDAADFYIQQLVREHGGDYSRAMAAYGGFKTKDPSHYVGRVLKGVGPGSALPPAAESPGLGVAKLGAMGALSGIKGGDQLVEVGKMMQEQTVPSGSYRLDPTTGNKTFMRDPYKEEEARFKRGESDVPGLTPEDKSALTRANLEKQAEALTKNYYDKMQGIPEQLLAVRNAREAAPKAVPFTGSMAEQKLAAAKFLNSNFGWMGVKIQPEAVQNAEQLRAALFVPIFNSLKLLDAQPSEQQQKLMMLAFGQIGTDPSALPKLIDMIEERLESRVKAHNRMYEEAKAAGAPIIYDLRVQLPEKKPATQSPPAATQPQAPTPNAAAQQGAPMTLDQYLQKYRKPQPKK